LSRTSYPRIPAFDFIPAFPWPFDLLLLLSFLAALIAFVLPVRIKGVAVFAVLAAGFLVVQDQSRLQPWFLLDLFLLTAIAFSENEEDGLNACRVAVAAAYFWSGVHKMNSSFSGALFPWLVSPISVPWLKTTLHAAGVMAPFLEAGMGLALLAPRTRRPAVVGIAGMHLFLLSMLGPWALNWNHVVWPWNLSMLVVTPCLFWNSNLSAASLLRPGRAWVRRFVLAFVLVFPPLSLAGLFDTSPAFDLYSGNSLIGSIVLNRDAWSRLDAERKAFGEPFGEGYRIRFGDWAMAAMNVPAYPEERVLRRLARSFCSVDAGGNGLILILEKPAGWMYRAGWRKIEGDHQFCR
jgi:hypothetical protein